MNCQTVQNKILALPDPRHVPDSLREHVQGCAGCRVWAEQASRLETLLEQLPVPAAPEGKKARFVEQLTHDKVPVEVAPSRFATIREFLRENRSLVGGIAAAVVIAIGAWLWFPRGGDSPEMAQQTPQDPFLAKIVQRDIALSQANTEEKLVILSDLANDLSAEARGLARIANPDELRDVARWYDRVVTDGLMKHAPNVHPLNPAERKTQLEALAGKLNESANEVEELATQVPPGAQPELRKIVNTARSSEKKLRALARGEN